MSGSAHVAVRTFAADVSTPLDAALVTLNGGSDPVIADVSDRRFSLLFTNRPPLQRVTPWPYQLNDDQVVKLGP